MTWATFREYQKKSSSIESDRVSWILGHEDNQFSDLRKNWDDLNGLLFLLKIFLIEFESR